MQVVPDDEGNLGLLTRDAKTADAAHGRVWLAGQVGKGEPAAPTLRWVVGQLPGLLPEPFRIGIGQRLVEAHISAVRRHLLKDLQQVRNVVGAELPDPYLEPVVGMERMYPLVTHRHIQLCRTVSYIHSIPHIGAARQLLEAPLSLQW